MAVAREVTWVADEKSFQAIASRAQEDSVVPILIPDCAARRERWARVLDEYSNQEHSPAVAVDSLPAAGQGLVAVLGPVDAVVRATAGMLAASARRELKVFDDPVALIDDVTRRSDRSLLVVASARSLPRTTTAQLSARIDIPWGIVTAGDSSGLTFVAAKMMLHAQRRTILEPWGIVDVLRHRMLTPTATGTQVADLPDGFQVANHLTEPVWGGLALVAHGEGGHLNLSDVVLCGLTDDVERTVNNIVRDGCSAASGIRTCKRASPDRTVISYSDIRATWIGLFTCSSSPVALEPYPSNVSGVLSALDGWPSAVITTDRILTIDEREPAFAWRMLRAGTTLGAVLGMLNDVQMRRLGARPYVLYGDPMAASFDDPDGESAVRVQPVNSHLLSSPEAVVEILAPKHTDVDVLAGAVHAFVAPHDPTTAGTSFDVIDRTDDLRACSALFVRVANQLAAVRNVERALTRFGASTSSLTEETQRRIALLTVIRVQLEGLVQGGFRECERIRLSGEWDSTVTNVASACLGYVVQWTRSLAEILADENGCPVFDIPIDGFRSGNRVFDSTCRSCGNWLATAAYTWPAGGQAEWRRADCPLCGEDEVWQVGSPRLEMDDLRPMERDETSTVRLRLDLPSGEDPFAAANLVVVALYERGRGTDWFREVLPVPGRAMEVAIPPNPTLVSELHTLTVIWIHGLDITVVGRRWPAGISDAGDRSPQPGVCP